MIKIFKTKALKPLKVKATENNFFNTGIQNVRNAFIEISVSVI